MHDCAKQADICSLPGYYAFKQVIALSTGLAINWPVWEVGRRQETFGHHKLMGIYHFNLLTSIGLNYWFDKL